MKFEYSAGAFVYFNEYGRSMFLVLTKQNGEKDLAKGHIEKGESAEDAAKREIYEETGIVPEFLPWFSSGTEYFFKQKGETIHKNVKFFIARTNSAEVRISKEHRGYEWMDYESMRKNLAYKDLREVMRHVKEYIDRYERMLKLNEEYGELPERQKEWKLSRSFVPGEGRLDARVMLVGQAPGQNEDTERRPFIGMSGKLLDRTLRKNSIQRKNAYITSIVQFFPPENRIPTQAEIEICKPFLMKQIEIIKPEYVVLMGNVPNSGILGIGSVESNHGKLIEKDGVKYIVTIHPAAAVRIKKKVHIIEEDFSMLGKLLKEDRRRQEG